MGLEFKAGRKGILGKLGLGVIEHAGQHRIDLTGCLCWYFVCPAGEISDAS